MSSLVYYSHSIHQCQQPKAQKWEFCLRKMQIIFIELFSQEGDEFLFFGTCQCSPYSKAFWFFLGRSPFLTCFKMGNSCICLIMFPTLSYIPKFYFVYFPFKLIFSQQHARYDQLLKTSHDFNILDSRGFVGVTVCARYFGRMRRWGFFSGLYQFTLETNDIAVAILRPGKYWEQ